MDKKINSIQLILAALLFFAVVYRVPTRVGEMRAWLEVFFEIAISLSLAAVIWNQNKYVSMFLILTTVSMFWPFYGRHSYLAGRAVFNGCLWFFLIVQYVNKVDVVLDAICWIAIIHIFIALIQVFEIESLVRVQRPTGLMSNPLELSGLSCFALPAFLRGKWMKWSWIPIIGVIVARQSIGAVAIGVGAVYYLSVVYGSRWFIWSVIIIVPTIILYVIFLDFPGITLRLYVWERAIMAWWQHPLTGAGIGHWKVIFNKPMKIDGCTWMTTHNEFLQMLFETGALFIPICVGYFINIFRKINKKSIIPAMAIVMISIHSAAWFPFHIAPTAMIAVTWLGILTITLNKENLKCQMTM